MMTEPALNVVVHRGPGRGDSATPDNVNPYEIETRSSCPPHKPMTAVVVDHRESGSGVIDALKRMPGVDAQLEQLALGDYLVNGVCLFERKTLPDFVESLIDGRLFSQAIRLSTSPLRTAVILEGTGRDLQRSAIRRETLLGAIISLTLIFDIPVLRSREPEETARLLVYAAQQLHRDGSDALPRHGRRPKRKRRIQLRLLQGLPGIGPGRATALLEHFGTVRSVMTATAEALRAVPGIGQTTARRIQSALD